MPRSLQRSLHLVNGDAVAQPFHFTRQEIAHTTTTSNFNPKVALGNARIELHQMRSAMPLPMSSQVKHALSNSSLFER